MLQRRTTGKLDFMKRWRQYIAGFGDMNDEFWIGKHFLQTLKHVYMNSNGVFPLSFTPSICLFPQVWIRYMSSPTLQRNTSCGLTWAWAQRGPTLYMTILRSLPSNRSSNSPLANIVGQQVGLLILKSLPDYKCSFQGVFSL